MNLNKEYDSRLLRTVAVTLYMLDIMPTGLADSKRQLTKAEVESIHLGAIKMYNNNAIFNNRVNTMMAQILNTINKFDIKEILKTNGETNATATIEGTATPAENNSQLQDGKAKDVQEG